MDGNCGRNLFEKYGKYGIVGNFYGNKIEFMKFLFGKYPELWDFFGNCGKL